MSDAQIIEADRIAGGMMKALSIRQPWAWLTAAGIKTIENRNWNTTYRGPVLIHASSYRSGRYMSTACEEVYQRMPTLVPRPEDLRYGGIIGVADLVDVVMISDSPWFDGRYGWVLANARRLPFVKLPGQLRLFDVDAARHAIELTEGAAA